MARLAKVYRRLDLLEADFRHRLAAELAACVSGRNGLLFYAHEFLPAGYGKLDTSKADELLADGEEIRKLREKVGEPFRGTLAFRFRNACRTWLDGSNPRQGGTATIAQRLLAEITATAVR